MSDGKDSLEEQELEKESAPQEKREAWFSARHIVALGVCALLLLAALALIFNSLATAAPPSFIKDTGAYKEAVKKAHQSLALREALGSPVDDGSYFRGEIQEGDENGAAKFLLQLKGSKAKGQLRVEAQKSKGAWSFQVLELTPKGELKTLNLLLEAPQGN